jgi:hypothetical protein
MHYEDLFRTIETHRVEYAVAGGVALVLHGVARLTVDLDLVGHTRSRHLLVIPADVGQHRSDGGETDRCSCAVHRLIFSS